MSICQCLILTFLFPVHTKKHSVFVENADGEKTTCHPPIGGPAQQEDGSRTLPIVRLQQSKIKYICYLNTIFGVWVSKLFWCHGRRTHYFWALFHCSCLRMGNQSKWQGNFCGFALGQHFQVPTLQTFIFWRRVEVGGSYYDKDETRQIAVVSLETSLVTSGVPHDAESSNLLCVHPWGHTSTQSSRRQMHRDMQNHDGSWNAIILKYDPKSQATVCLCGCTRNKNTRY